MQIKITRPPQPQDLPDCSFQGLKKSLLKNQSATESLIFGNKTVPKSQFIQINYLKDCAYKISPQIHSNIPLLRQQQNFRDYLLELHTDHERLHSVNNQIKQKYFIKNKTSSNLTQTHRSDKKIEMSSKNSSRKSKDDDIYLFDPIEYLEQKNKRHQRKLFRQTRKLQQLHSFADDIESVKYVQKGPQIRNPKTFPVLGKRSDGNFINRNREEKVRQKNQQQINNSLNEILQKSIKFQSEQKLNANKLRSYKSRSELQRQTEQRIKSQRNKMMRMIFNKEVSQQKPKTNRATSIDQIAAKQKYSMDFVSYLRTKTKNQLDKYIHEKLVKKPQKDLEKFQQFMLKEVKFQNQQNKNQMERFFIKMREEFRRIQKYTKKGSSFDWRSKSMHLDQAKKQDTKMLKSKLFQQKLLNMTNGNEFPKNRVKGTFINIHKGKRIKSKVDRIMEQYINLRNQQIKNKQLRENFTSVSDLKECQNQQEKQ